VLAERVIEDQKIVVGRTTFIKRAKKSRGKKPASQYSRGRKSMTTTRMTCESLKRDNYRFSSR
jgi:hypothetical protein